MMSQEKINKLILPTEVGALAVTFLAHLGGHQEIHYHIANVAMCIETLTIASVIASNMLREDAPERSRFYTKWAVAGLIATVGCFLAVPATDIEYLEFFTSGRAADPNNWLDYGRFWARDAWRDISNGFNELPKLIDNLPLRK